IDDVQVVEGDSGTTTATLTVTLSAASSKTISVGFATTDGSATAPGDYTPASGALIFTPGQTSQTLAVAIAGDTLDELDETLSVDLSNASNATIADGHGVVTIVNDDHPPVASDDTATTNEDSAVTVNFLANDSDADGDTLAVIGMTQGNHGITTTDGLTIT